MWSEWISFGPVLQHFFLVVIGLSAGLSVASGVFTVFTAVGLVPRFAEHTKTGDHIMKYENMIIVGCFAGCIYSLFVEHWAGLQLSGAAVGFSAVVVFAGVSLGDFLAAFVLGVSGLFTGIYVGTLAISIAEMLDAIPIMTHRINLKRGVSLVIAGLAVGKLIGSLFYYAGGVYGW